MKSFYILRDLVACTFGVPVLFATDDDARRGFSDLISDKATIYGKHPEDFALYKIGAFDDRSAVITPCEPEILISGDSVVHK